MNFAFPAISSSFRMLPKSCAGSLRPEKPALLVAARAMLVERLEGGLGDGLRRFADGDGAYGFRSGIGRRRRRAANLADIAALYDRTVGLDEFNIVLRIHPDDVAAAQASLPVIDDVIIRVVPLDVAPSPLVVHDDVVGVDLEESRGPRHVPFADEILHRVALGGGGGAAGGAKRQERKRKSQKPRKRRHLRSPQPFAPLS